MAGFGPINGAGTSDMLMRNSNTGAFEVFDIANNQLAELRRRRAKSATEWSVGRPGRRSTNRFNPCQRPVGSSHGVIWGRWRLPQQFAHSAAGPNGSCESTRSPVRFNAQQ